MIHAPTLSDAASMPLLAAFDLTSTLALVVFFGAAALAVVSAIVAAAAPKIVHAAFGLLGAFFGVAVLYGLLGADFVALSQVIIYIGGILVLLVFGVLLTGRVRSTLGIEEKSKPAIAIVAGLLVFFGLFFGIRATSFAAMESPGEPLPTTARIGHAFLNVPMPTQDPDEEGLAAAERESRLAAREQAEKEAVYLVPFELASVLLLAALVGAAYLARRRREP
jgi:NADH-quinone oxidoreductase subunit J